VRVVLSDEIRCWGASEAEADLIEELKPSSSFRNEAVPRRLGNDESWI